MDKYCHMDFDQFILQGDARGDFGSDGFITNYFVLSKCLGEGCHPIDKIDEWVQDLVVQSNHVSMGIVPEKWYEYSSDKENINPF